MKTIVVYYSLEGNTDHAAKLIAKELGADLLRLETETPYPTGAKKFLLGGRDALKGACPTLKPYSFDAEAYDTVILGTPLWAWTFAPPLRSFLNREKIQGKKMAFFVTSMGGQDKKCFAAMKQEMNADAAPELSLLEPLKKQKEADMEKIRQFAEQIKSLS